MRRSASNRDFFGKSDDYFSQKMSIFTIWNSDAKSVFLPISPLLAIHPRSDWITSPETNLSVFGGIFSQVWAAGPTDSAGPPRKTGSTLAPCDVWWLIKRIKRFALSFCNLLQSKFCTSERIVFRDYIQVQSVDAASCSLVACKTQHRVKHLKLLTWLSWRLVWYQMLPD